jgi:DNA adenine methylase
MNRISPLTRRGSKARIAEKLLAYFPPAEKIDYYMEPFFGSGAIFFAKEKSKYSFLNDKDLDVYNLFEVIRTEPEKLEFMLRTTLIHEHYFYQFRDELKAKPAEPIDVARAFKFLFCTEVSLYGRAGTYAIAQHLNANTAADARIKACSAFLQEKTYFIRGDFKHFINMMGKKYFFGPTKKTFIYCDPPYLGTQNNYDNFTINETSEMFDILTQKALVGCKFAVSEFDSDITRDLAKQYNLNVFDVCERRNIKNRRTELLLTNYTIEETRGYNVEKHGLWQT